MTVGEWWLLLVAGFGAGVIGSTAGLASLVSYPALLLIGLPPVTANVTNTVGLIGSSIGSVAGSRRELSGLGPLIVRRVPVAVVGGATGAALLLLSPPGSFAQIVPYLVATASVCQEVNDLESAARDLDEAIGLAPEWAAAHFERGKVWLRLATEKAHFFDLKTGEDLSQRRKGAKEDAKREPYSLRLCVFAGEILTVMALQLRRKTHESVIYIDRDSAPRIMPSGEDFILEDLPIGTRVLYPNPSIKGLPNREAAIRYALNHPLGCDPLPLLSAAGIEPTARAEEIPVEGFVALAHALEHANMRP